MIYGFDTKDQAAATGALLVYGVYRSRDRHRYKTGPDMWAQIERFTKAAAKRARSLPVFLEALKPKLACGTIHPRWIAVGEPAEAPLLYRWSDSGSLREVIQRAPQPGQREFLTRVVERADTPAVLRALVEETAWVIMLVRDRLERERPIEDDLLQPEDAGEEDTIDA